MGSHLPQDQTTTVYRVIALESDMRKLENDVKTLKEQLHLYVPERENDLKLQRIQDTVVRIEKDVQDIKIQQTTLGTKLENQDKETQRRDTEQRETQDKLQIKVLWGVVSIVLTVLTALLIAYLTHIIH